jgi:putative aminopeptidase FrvX
MIEQSQIDTLLNDLYSIHSTTGHELPMIAIVREYIEKHIPVARIKMDQHGNLYITKGETSVG